MSLFRCNKCGAVENTALCEQGQEPQIERAIKRGFNGLWCSECVTGTWHARFPKDIVPETDPCPNCASLAEGRPWWTAENCEACRGTGTGAPGTDYEGCPVCLHPYEMPGLVCACD